MTATAVISHCGKYRYELGRKWSAGPAIAFVMLNPSTADATYDDATINKCIRYAMRWDYGELKVVNLFAYRATDPKEMMRVADPVGLTNDEAILRVTASVRHVVAAWGAFGSYRGRDAAVKAMLPRLLCVHKTKDGHPGHPLYVKGDARPVPFNYEEDHL